MHRTTNNTYIYIYTSMYKYVHLKPKSRGFFFGRFDPFHHFIGSKMCQVLQKHESYTHIQHYMVVSNIFHVYPDPWGDDRWSNLTSIFFQMGWNHQLEQWSNSGMNRNGVKIGSSVSSIVTKTRMCSDGLTKFQDVKKTPRHQGSPRATSATT